MLHVLYWCPCLIISLPIYHSNIVIQNFKRSDHKRPTLGIIKHQSCHMPISKCSYMARLKKKHQEDMCYDEIGICAQNTKHHSKFNSAHGYKSLCNRIYRKKTFTLTSSNFYISARILTRKMTIFMTHNCNETIHDLMQQTKHVIGVGSIRY